MLGKSPQQITNIKVQQRTKVTDMIERLQWKGHVTRQDTDRSTAKVTTWRPRQIRKSIGRSHKRWVYNIRKDAG